MEDLDSRDPPLTFRRLRSLASRQPLAILVGTVVPIAGLVGRLAGQGTPATPLTLLSKDGRRPVPVSIVTDQEFVALDDLSAIFQLSVREDSLGAITVSYKTK